MKATFNTISFYGIPINKPTAKSVVKTSENIISNPLDTLPIIKKTIPEKGVLPGYEIDLINRIGELFETAHNLTKATAKALLTVSRIKNGYPKKKKGIPGSKILEFEKIGPKGEDISINYRIDHGKTKKAIIIIDGKQYVINPKGEIEKNPSMRFIGNTVQRKKGDTIEYFTQNEIDKLDINRQLFALEMELKKYIDYINAENNKLIKWRENKSDNPAGSVDKYQKLIDSVTEKFKYFKTHINKLSQKALDKDTFRILNKIKTFHAQSSIMFKNASPDERSLFLVYSTINRVKAMKVFLMNYNNKTVCESYVIYKNKLAKFFPKKPNDKPKHLEYDFHYYTQEEIDNSMLEKLLKIIDKRLDEINNNLNKGIEERKAKRKRI